MRLDHFEEVLCQFQGKEGKDIPKEVIERIKELEHVRKDNAFITPNDLKQSLRSLSSTNIPYIHQVLTRTPHR